MEIKKLVDEEDYVIIPDTNVLLNLYRYSPEFSEFGIQCLKQVVSFLYLPATIRLEFGKHCRAAFANMEARINNANKETKKQVRIAKEKILSSCSSLERLQFPDVDKFRNELEVLLDKLSYVASDFFEERKGLELISHYWNGVDKVADLVAQIEQHSHILSAPTQEEIFIWCEEGKTRYKKGIPPGFKDGKNKDGVRKYGDLIIWKELLKFAHTQSKNIIFVTDDVKADWWETQNNKRVFHSKLLSEFSKTGHKIVAYESQEFYSTIANEYGVSKTDAVELALQMTDNDYCTNIKDKVFENIMDDLTFSGTDYIDTDNAYIGTEGIEELEIESFDFISAERVARDNDIVIYHFKYTVDVSGTSYDYWGRDDDTKEVILSYGIKHKFEGILTVEVEREADIFIDFEDSDTFDKTHIVDGALHETYHQELFDDPQYEQIYGEYGNCPDCGNPLNDDNIGANGFCINCAPNH